MKHLHIKPMKSLAFCLAVWTTGCVSVDLPGVVSDTAKVTKETYRSVVGSKDEAKAPPPANDGRDSVTNSTIGSATQTLAQIKQLCQEEAEAKLRKHVGADARVVLVDSSTSTVNASVVVHCRVGLERVAAEAPAKK
jgi:hypothetical protein